jgi:beta-lactam-binding protein with PASTA domain
LIVGPTDREKGRAAPIIRKVQRNRTNEILTGRIRWLQPAREKQTTNNSPRDRTVDYDVIVPAGALLALHLDVQRERQSRPAQTRFPELKGLSYEDAETKLHASNLNIRLLATRYDLPIQPGLVIDQSPQSGEEVVYGYPVGVTVTNAETLRK